MDLTARDIHEKLFHDAWRGYNQEEVDDFLDRVAEVLDRVQRENEILQKRVAELDSAVAASRDTEEMLKKTLVSAQQAAEEAIATAKAKASDLITEAEERARTSIEEADERVQTAAAEARRKTLEAEREHERRRAELDANIERLQGLENELKSRIKGFLDMQAQALQGLEIVGPPPEILGPTGAPSPEEVTDQTVPTPEEAAQPPEGETGGTETGGGPAAIAEPAAGGSGGSANESAPGTGESANGNVSGDAPRPGGASLVDDSTAAETAARVVTLPDASGNGGDRPAEAGHGRRGTRGLLWRDEG